MSFLTSLQNFITETEADVLKVVVAIKADAAIVQADLVAAEHWIASNTPAIAANIQQVLALVEEVGVGSNPEVALAVTAANVAVKALNAFATASEHLAPPRRRRWSAGYCRSEASAVGR